jgi:hypothetical protein
MSLSRAGLIALACSIVAPWILAPATAEAATPAGAVQLSSASYLVAPGAGAVTITVNRVGGASGAATATYSTIDGTATAGTDYSSVNGALSWADGDASARSFVIPVNPSGPGGRSFDVSLLSAIDAAFGSPINASVSISVPVTPVAAAPASPGAVEFSQAAYDVAGGSASATIQVDRVGGSHGAVIANYSTFDGSALAGTDYVPVSGTLSWPDGDASPRSFAIPLVAGASGDKSLSVALLSAAGALFGAPINATVSIGMLSDSVAYDPHILVDQFGYRPLDPKVAVIRNPDAGYDLASSFIPGSLYQLRRASDGAVVYAAAPTPWNAGAIEPSSGDNGWWFDFSSVTTPGTYFVYDVSLNLRSPTFSINELVYQNVLQAAMRMFFYDRAGMAKSAPYADACWQDAAAYLGPNQDSQAHDITDPTNAAKVRDLSGGWFDAGDTNKYVSYAAPAVHQLLTAYQENPGVFTDDFNIPESGNGIPDILDEVKWEIDWMQKMQFPDGSVAMKVGGTVYANASPPSTDLQARFYVPGCTSATIAAAGAFAHAAYVFGSVPALAASAAALQADAVAAWNNYNSIPAPQTACDSGIVLVPGSDISASRQAQAAVVAAIYLYAITGNSAYNAYVEANYQLLHPYQDVGWARYEPEQGEALLFYTTLPQADPVLRSAILAFKLSDTLQGTYLYGFNAADDLYRNNFEDYYWGSNHMRANYGNSNAEVLQYGIAVASTVPYQTRALETLHYMHGVNPFAKVYLSNMYAYGATDSVNELYGAWFIPGSIWADARTAACGPAPGYLTGGPDAQALADGIPATQIPPVGQPAQKSYWDWNGAAHSWVISEPAIYDQASYVELLAAFAQ